MPENVADRLAKRMQREELTPRKMDVLDLLVKGRSNKEIAAAIQLAEAAVKFQLKGLFAKPGVQDRTVAVVSALRHGIVQLIGICFCRSAGEWGLGEREKGVMISLARYFAGREWSFESVDARTNFIDSRILRGTFLESAWQWPAGVTSALG